MAGIPAVHKRTGELLVEEISVKRGVSNVSWTALFGCSQSLSASIRTGIGPVAVGPVGKPAVAACRRPGTGGSGDDAQPGAARSRGVEGEPLRQCRWAHAQPPP